MSSHTFRLPGEPAASKSALASQPLRRLSVALATALGASLAPAAAATSVTRHAGFTDTTITQTSTNQIDVSTVLKSGSHTAFNGFATFDIDGGDTVNLHLPSGAQNLVNLVDTRAIVNGTVNSYLSSGTVGGHVFFADAQGMVVGSSGVLNVGALSIVTPAAASMNLLYGDAVSGGGATTTALLQGSLAHDSADVTIDGTIHATSGVRIQAKAIDASGTIFVTGGANGSGFDTAVNTGDDGAVTLVQDDQGIRLTGETIDLKTGSLLDATGTGGHPTHDVSLLASAEAGSLVGMASADSHVIVDGSIKAANVSISASSRAIADYSNLNDTINTLAGGLPAGLLDIGLPALPIGYIASDSNARVELGAHANIAASGNVDLQALTHAKSATSALNAVGSGSVVAAAIYGQITGDTTAQVDAGATVSAGGAFNVKAVHSHELEIESKVSGDSGVAVAVAVGNVKTSTQSSIAAGANITANDVSVLSHNQASYSVGSEVEGTDKSPAGINVGLLFVDTTSNATNAANLGTVANPINSLTVSATSTTSKMAVSTETKVGDEAEDTPPSKIVAGGGADLAPYLEGKLGEFFTKADDSAAARDGSTPPAEDSDSSALRAGMSVSLIDASQQAHANIADGTVVHAAGDVVVNGNVTSAGTSNSASTETKSSEDNGAELSASVAVAVGLIDNNAQALIGSNATISGAHIGVGSDVSVPWDLSSITDFSNVPSALESIYGALKASGAPLTTSYVNAQSESDKVGLAGSVNFFAMNNASTAWVGNGTTLATTGSNAAWTSAIALGDDPSGEETLEPIDLDWDTTLAIQAHTLVQTISDAGNFDLLHFNGTKGGGGDATAVGGAVNIVNYSNTTLAGIGADADVSAAGVAVNADSTEQLVSITPSAGRGAGIAGNVIFAMASTNDITHASISNSAKVDADSVDIAAHQGLGAWSIAGAVAQGTSVGIGVAVAINDLTGDTHAYVGDNSADAALVDPTLPAAASAAAAGITTDDLRVTASTDGRSGAISIAGSAAKEKKETPPAGGGTGGTGGTGDTGTEPTTEPVANASSPKFVGIAADKGDSSTSGFSIDSVLGKLPMLGDLMKTGQGQEGKAQDGGGSAQKKPSFGLALSGSASVDLGQLDTRATIDDASIDRRSGSDASDVTVQALNQTDLISASGAGALASAGKDSSGSAGIAGAVAYSSMDNSTEAHLDQVTMAHAGDVTVQALSGGSIIDLGLGLAVNTASDQKSAAVAGSFSISQIANSTHAYIGNSSLTAADATKAVDVTSYDHTDIGAGGGSFAIGGSKGVGIGVTYSDIGNQNIAAISNSTFTGFDPVTVQALTAARIAAGAASVAVSSGSESLDLSGAFVVNLIGNTTSASIDGNSTLANGHGDVTVKASGSAPVGALDDQLVAQGHSDAAASLIDFSGTSIGGDDAPGAAIFGVAGEVAGGGNSGGLSFTYNSIGNSFVAQIVNADVSTTGNVDVAAIDNTRIIGMAIGIGASTGDFAGVGSGTANLINDNVSATIGDADAGSNTTTIDAGAVGIDARNTAVIDTLAGNVTIATNGAAAGLAVAFNEIGNQTSASVTHSQVTTSNATLQGCDGGAAAVAVSACSSGTINSAAVGVAGGADLALTASLAINDIGVEDSSTLGSISGALRETFTHASIDASALDTQSVGVHANNDSEINTLSGAIAISESAAAGAGFSLENIGANTAASFTDSQLAATGAVNVGAGTTGKIAAIAVGGAVSGDIAFGGSLTANIIGNHTEATVSGLHGAGSNAATMSSLDIDAADSAQIDSLAGTLAVGASGVGIGGASSVNTIANVTHATLSDSKIDASLSTTVNAASNAAINTLAAVGAGGSGAGIAGALTVNDIDNDIAAKTSGVILDDAANVTRISAANTAAILSSADAVAVSGGVSAGAAIAVNRIGTDVVAEMSGGNYHAKDITIDAGSSNPNSDDSANIKTMAVGVGGGSVGVAASIAVNVETGSSRADITGGAQVTAENNVAVLASNHQGMDVLAGSLGIGVDAVGLGLGTVVNVLGDSTQAYIDGSTTHVNALAKDATDTLTVASGSLADPDGVDVSMVQSIDDYADPDLSEGSRQRNGLAVNAQSQQAVATLGVSAALSFDPLGSAALTAMTGVNVLGGSTSAYIDGAKINQDGQAGAGSAQAVDVTASSHQYAASFIAGIAGGASDFAGAGAIDVSTFNRSTKASIDNATLSSNGTTSVDAESSQRSVALATGLAAAITGGAATGVVNVFNADTEASVDRGTLDVHDLDVSATSENDASMNGGAGAFGAAGVAGTFLLSSSSNTTNAFVGDDDGDTHLHATGAVNVSADSSTDLGSLMLSGAVGAGGPAVAGMAAVTTVGNHTNAYLDRVQLDQGDSYKAGDVSVSAHESIDLSPKTNAAALSAGSVAAGAAANVVLLDSQVGAAIRNSAISSGGTVDVHANSEKSIDALTISGSVGLDAGLSGAISAVIFGNGSLTDNTNGDDPDSELNKGGTGTLSKLDSFGQGDALSDAAAGGQLSSSELASINGAGKVSLLSGGNLNRGADGTTAGISGSSITADTVNVHAENTTAVSNVVGNLAGGGLIGAGGAVAFSVVNQDVGATVDADSVLTTTSALNVGAHVHNGTVSNDGHTYTLDTQAYQGAFGFVGLGAAVAYSELNNNVLASLGGTSHGNQTTVISVQADDASALNASGGGATGGGLAAGVVVSQAHKASSITAALGDYAVIDNALSLAINAGDSGRSSADATAVSAGLAFAANGADANAADSATVLARVGKHSSTTLHGGDLTLGASQVPDLVARSFGVAISGGLSMGASIATADLSSNVTALVDDHAAITTTGATNVSATQNTAVGTDGSSAPGVYAKAVGGAGGVLVGANASVAKATSTATVKAATGDYVSLPFGAINLVATNASTQSAIATGVGAGFVGLGAAYAEASADTGTFALLGSNNTGAASRTGMLSLSANATDSNSADSTSGSGGVISGNAAVAKTNDTADTQATVGANTQLTAGLVNINALHNSNYQATATAIGAGVANASGAITSNDIDSDVTTSIGDHAGLYANGLIAVGARNVFTDTNPNPAVQGGGGGVLSGAAAANTTNITGNTLASMGASSMLAAGLDQATAAALVTKYEGQAFNSTGDIFANAGSIYLVAGSELHANDTVTLDSGGAVAGSGVSSKLYATLNNNVTLADSDNLVTNGDLGLGTYTQVNAAQNALTHTYGGGAQGSAVARTEITSNQNVSVGTNDTLLAFGLLNVTAGVDPTGFLPTSIIADATAQSYVRGIIAIATGEADTVVHSNAHVDIGGGARVLSGGDINLGTYESAPRVSAEGTGHGYELGFIPITSDDSNASAYTTGGLNVAGSVIAGIYHDSDVTIAADGSLSHDTGAPLFYLYRTDFNPHNYIAQYTAGLEDNTDSSGNTGVPTSAGASAPTPPAGLPIANGGDTGSSSTPIGSSSDPTNLGGGNPDEVSVAGILAGTTTAGPTKAYLLGSLYAAGGNVTLHTGSFSGSGSVTAWGGPQVSVSNASAAYLVLGDITVPNSSGGQVLFTGIAGADKKGSLSVIGNGAGATPAVTIANTYNGTVKNPGETITQGPAIFLGGNIINQGGLVDISNVSGSVGQFAPISAQQIKENVPNGAVAVYLPGGTYHSGNDPIATFAQDQINLGDANSAVNYVANAVFNASGQYNGLGNLADIVFTNAVYHQSVSDSYQPSGGAYIFFGQCAPYAGGSDCSSATANTFTGNSIDFHGASLPMLHVRSLSKSVATDDRDLTSNASALNAQVIAVKAKYIDINSQITAGHSTNYTITVNANFDDFVAANQGRQGLIDVPAGYWSSNQVAVTGAPPLVQYDATNKRIVVSNINASGGGFVSLDGGIISTAAIGNITINDGYGHVSIANNSHSAVQVADINTGNNALGELKITDTFKSYSVGGQSLSQTHWYVNQQGVGTVVYNNSNGATQYANGVQQQTLGDGVGTSYNPETGLRYGWTEQVNMARPEHSLFDGTTWQYVDTNGFATSTPTYTVTSTGVFQDLNDASAFKETITGAASYGGLDNGYASILNVAYHGCDDGDCHYGFPQTPVKDWNGNDAGFYQYIYLTNAQLNITKSVRADYGFNINFAGNASGQVNVNSGGSILVGGNIYNPGGTTTLDASASAGSSILGGVGAGIISKGLTLKATDAVGSDTTPLQVTLTGGTLAVDAGTGGAYLDVASAVSLDHVVAARGGSYGDVELQADGAINAVSGSSLVSGRNITLTSKFGNVGNTSTPLLIDAHATRNPDASYSQGVVNISALNDIGVRQTEADLRVGSIASIAGNVMVDVPNGSIIDASGLTSGQALSAEQLLKVRAALHLTDQGGDNGTAAAYNNTILGFQAAVDASYATWWQLRNNGVLDGDVLTLKADKVELYRSLVAADRGVAASSLSVADIQQYAADKYAATNEYLAANVADFGSGAAFQTFDAHYAYTASQTQIDTLTANAVYTPGQLVSAINQSALNDPGSTPVGSGTPNISGRTVTLSAHKNIGALGDSASISYADLINGTLNDDDAAALAVANAPGDVTLVRDANGDITRIDVKQTQPLFLDATGTVSASNQAGSGGSIYLQANGDLALGNIHSDRDVRLVAVGNITDTLANPDTPVITAGGDLTLLAGSTGSVGHAASTSGGVTTPATAVSYSIGGTLLAAEAGQDVVLRALGHDLVFDRIGAGNSVVLQAPNGSILQALDGLAINAKTIDLTASGNIGYLGDAARYLQLQTGSDGALGGSAGGYAMLYSPTAGGLLTVDGFTSGGAMVISSNGALAADALSSGAALTLSSAGDATLGTLNSHDATSISALGDVTLQSATSQLAGGTAVNILAGGAISGTDDGSHAANITVLPDATVNLQAGTGIGAPLRIDGSHVSASTDAGDLFIAMLADLTGGQFTASLGSIDLTGNGNLDIASLDAWQNATVQADGGITGDSVIAHRGDATLDAQDDIALNSVAAGGKAEIDSANGAITVGGADSGGDMSLASQGDIDAGHLVSGGTLDAIARAGSIHATQLQGSDDITLTSSGDLGFDALTGDGNLQANAGGNIDGHSTDVVGSADLVSIGATTLDDVHTGIDLTVDAASIVGGNVAAGRDLQLTSTGNTALTTASAGRDSRIASDSLAIGTLDVANDAIVNVTHAAQAQRLTTGGNLDASVGDLATLHDVQVGGDASLHAGALDIDSLKVTGKALADTVAAMQLGAVDIGGGFEARAGTTLGIANFTGGTDAFMTSGGASQLGIAHAGHDLTVNAGSTLDATTLSSGNDLTLASIGDSTLGSVDAGHDLSITADNLSATALRSGTDTVLVAGHAIRVNQLAAHGLLDARAGTDASFATLDVAETATLHAGGAVELGQATVGNDLHADAGSSLHAAKTTVGHDALLAAATSMQLDQLDVGNTATLKAGGALGIDSAKVGNDLVADAGSTLKLGSAQVAHDALLTAAAAMQLDQLSAGRDIYGTAGDDLGFGQLTAGRDIVLRSLRGHVQGGGLDAAHRLDVAAHGDIGFDTAHSGDDTVLVAQTGSIHGGALDAGSTVDASAAIDIDLGKLVAVNDVTLTAGRDLAVGELKIADGSLRGTSGRDLQLDGYDVNGNVALDAGRNMTIGSGNATGTLDLTLGGSLDFVKLTNAGAVSIDARGGSIHGGDLITDVATLGARDGITLDSSHIGSQLNLAAADIDAHVVQTRDDRPLAMQLTGYHDGVARHIVMEVQAPSEWLIQRLAAVQAVLDSAAPKTSIEDGTITGDMWLTTPLATLYMNNVSPTLVKADEQFYEPDTTFKLWQVGRTTLTDAFVSRYTVGFDVTTPDYIDRHVWTDLDYYGGSVLRYLGSTLTLHGPADHAGDDVAPSTTLKQGDHADDVVRSLGRLAVNLDAPL